MKKRIFLSIISTLLITNLNANTENKIIKKVKISKHPEIILLNTIKQPIKQEKVKLVIPDILNKDIEVKKDVKIVNSQFERTGPTIQLAILLDTSGSMDGLIEQTKTQIWKIINELSSANKNNKNVTIQVSLFEYGKSTISVNENYLRMLVPLTNDLDDLSEKLFNLKTNGGDEFAGAVILSSINRLNWSNHKDDLKLILIAGNESFNQGNVDYKFAIKKATDNNIIVNTIFCGDFNTGVNFQWKTAADIGNGKYMNISQNDTVKIYNTKYDNKINILGNKLNDTYISYNKKSEMRILKQKKQDMNSKKLSSSNLVERNIAKSSIQYKTSSWDLLSKFSSSNSLEKEEILTEASQSDSFKGMDKKEIEIKIELSLKEREKIQEEIKELKKLREKDISNQKLKENNDSNSKDIGSILISNIKTIAKENGYKFNK